MIWFNIKKLEKQISDDELTDKDGFNYLLAYVIFTAIVLSFMSNYSNGWIKFLTCVASVIITQKNSAFCVKWKRAEGLGRLAPC